MFEVARRRMTARRENAAQPERRQENGSAFSFGVTIWSFEASNLGETLGNARRYPACLQRAASQGLRLPGTTTTTSPCCAVCSYLAHDPKTFAPRLFARSIARTRFMLILRSISPPPPNRSAARPSRKDSSPPATDENCIKTLVIGAVLSAQKRCQQACRLRMLHSFRKSLTAWLQLPALPPTPRRKRRPFRSRNATSSVASFSTAPISISVQMRRTSLKKLLTCPLIKYPSGMPRLSLRD